jgi:hypothetical protein
MNTSISNAAFASTLLTLALSAGPAMADTKTISVWLSDSATLTKYDTTQSLRDQMCSMMTGTYKYAQSFTNTSTNGPYTMSIVCSTVSGTSCTPTAISDGDVVPTTWAQAQVSADMINGCNGAGGTGTLNPSVTTTCISGLTETGSAPCPDRFVGQTCVNWFGTCGHQ